MSEKKPPLRQVLAELQAKGRASATPSAASVQPLPPDQLPPPCPAPLPAAAPAARNPSACAPAPVPAPAQASIPIQEATAQVAAPPALPPSKSPAHRKVVTTLTRDPTVAVAPRNSLPGIAPSRAEAEQLHLAELSNLIERVNAECSKPGPEAHLVLRAAAEAYEAEKSALRERGIRLEKAKIVDHGRLTYDERCIQYARQLHGYMQVLQSVLGVTEALHSPGKKSGEWLRRAAGEPLVWAAGCAAAFGALLHFSGSFETIAAAASKWLGILKDYLVHVTYGLMGLYAAAHGLGLALTEVLHRRKLREEAENRRALAEAASSHAEEARYAITQLSEVWNGQQNKGLDDYSKLDALKAVLIQDEQLFQCVNLLTRGGDAKALKGLCQRAGLPPRLQEVSYAIYVMAETAILKKKLSPLLYIDDDAGRFKELHSLCAQDALFKSLFEKLTDRKAEGNLRHPYMMTNVSMRISKDGVDPRVVDAFLSGLDAGYRVTKSRKS